MIVTAELLRFPPSAKYRRKKVPDLPEHLFRELAQAAPAAGVKVRQTTRYEGKSDWLVLYGPGGLDRVEPMARQRDKGGHVICWDAAYWQRGTKLRVSVDHAHPQDYVMRKDWPATRLLHDGVMLKNCFSKAGPVILASIGAKARAQYGAAVVSYWEQQMVRLARSRWPDRTIAYRPKPNHPVDPPKEATLMSSKIDIDRVLTGASLLITWHSNVAVDAIRMGVPAVCMDGAAAAVCSKFLPDEDLRPLPEDLRLRFLQNLAHFQWAPTEAAQVWKFLRKLLL